MRIPAGLSVAIVGPSGSGKTTLLGILAGLDSPTSGSVTLRGHKLDAMTEDGRAAIRNQHVGFVFQSFHLIHSFTALENVMMPLELAQRKDARERALNLLDSVGLKDRSKHYPNQLSGGERQRVAIARAFACEPEVLFADEPTGNLDKKTGAKVSQLLFDMNHDRGTTLIIVTHDPNLASQCDRVIHIDGGELLQEPAE